jgi:glucose-1-phosphate adenylyltransferase
MKSRILALILGGGAGTRLFPLTQKRAKPAVPLAGKYRLVDIPISNCINSDISKIFVLTQYNSASLNQHVSKTYRFSEFSQGFVEILAAEQTPESAHWFQGTADAVRQVFPHLAAWKVDTVLLLSGDHLYRMDYRDFLARHRETKADLTISVIPCAREGASEFGLLKVDATGRITEFSEKPKGAALEAMRVDTRVFGLSAEDAAARPFLASMGIYVFNYEYLTSILNAHPEMVDFGKQVIPEAIRCCNVQAYKFDGYWEDIGTIAAFYQANLDTTRPEPQFNFFDTDAPIFTRPHYLPTSRVRACVVTDSTIGEGSVLDGAEVTRSVVGLRTRVAPGARIEDSIIMGADFYQTPEEVAADLQAGVPPVGIGEGAVIRRAIVDKNARIGRGVRLINAAGVAQADGPDESYYVREGIVIVPKNAVIKDGTVV